jgi:hypothetical protein
MATKKKKASARKPVKKAATTKRAINKTIISLRKEAALLEKFVATLGEVDEVPLTRKRVVKKKAAKKKVVKRRVAKKVAKKRIAKKK